MNYFLVFRWVFEEGGSEYLAAQALFDSLPDTVVRKWVVEEWREAIKACRGLPASFAASYLSEVVDGSIRAYRRYTIDESYALRPERKFLPRSLVPTSRSMMALSLPVIGSVEFLDL